MQASLIPLSDPRPPRANASCSCQHWVYCNHACHAMDCDPSADVCHLDYRPDEGGLAYNGCPDCTPGIGAPHLLDCEIIGWSVPMPVTGS